MLEIATRSANAPFDSSAPRVTSTEVVSRIYNALKWFAIRWSAQAVVPAFEQVDPDFALEPWRLCRMGVCLLLAASWFLSVRRGNHIEDYYIVCFLLLTVYQMHCGNPRYWVPGIPYFPAYIFALVRSIVKDARALTATAATAFGVGIVSLVTGIQSFEASPYEDPELADFVQVLNYAEKHLPPQAEMLSHHAQNAWLLSGMVQFEWKHTEHPLADLPDELYVVVWNTSKRFGKGERALIRRAGSSDEFAVSTVMQTPSHSLIKIARSDQRPSTISSVPEEST
jgi:hypothetical protein